MEKCSYIEALYIFCLKFQKLEGIPYEEKTLVYLGASAIFGFLVIILDIIAFKIKDVSFLGIHYSNNSKYFWIVIGWTIASTIVSLIGLVMNVFNTTVQSCAILGLSWLYIIIQITEKLSQPKIKQE